MTTFTMYSNYLYLSTDDAAAQFSAAPPICPGAASTFSCNVGGDITSITTWRVGGSSECSLLHRNAGDTDTCGPGNVFMATAGTGFGTAAILFSSTLSVTATPALNGTLIECFGPGSGGDLGNRVGSSMIHVLGQWRSHSCKVLKFYCFVRCFWIIIYCVFTLSLHMESTNSIRSIPAKISCNDLHCEYSVFLSLIPPPPDGLVQIGWQIFANLIIESEDSLC